MVKNHINLLHYCYYYFCDLYNALLYLNFHKQLNNGYKYPVNKFNKYIICESLNYLVKIHIIENSLKILNKVFIEKSKKNINIIK